LGDDLARLRLADSAWVGQLRQVLPVEDQQGFAPFLGFTVGIIFTRGDLSASTR
jgi:hypothetical protein